MTTALVHRLMALAALAAFLVACERETPEVEAAPEPPGLAQAQAAAPEALPESPAVDPPDSLEAQPSEPPAQD